MAYYSWKELRDVLMSCGKLDQFGEPIDKDTHGDLLECDYDGNIHEIAADTIRGLIEENKELKAKLTQEQSK